MAEYKRPASKGPKGPKKNGSSRDSNKSGSRDSSRFGGRNRPQRSTVTCASCSEKCQVPFKPTNNKPIYCDSCFKKDAEAQTISYGKDFAEIKKKLDLIMSALDIDFEEEDE